MKTITFISSLPDHKNSPDGYYRRVQNVESVFTGETRKHLDIRFWKHLRRRRYTNPEGIEVHQLNALLHIPIIRKILRQSEVVYVHSIAKVPGILLPAFLFPRKGLFVLDLHGVIPAEMRLAGRGLTAAFYSRLERWCYRTFDVMVYVTEVMRDHFRKKYPDCTAREVVFYTNTADFGRPVDDPADAPEELRDRLGIVAGEAVLLYSGNCQAWQNIDEMLGWVSRLDPDSYRLIILSGEQKKFRAKIRQHSLPADRVHLATVPPEELPAWYSLAHYGLILRDDILVNRVANPTKLTEYLQFGMIPVVKLAAIGDYLELGYEYLDYRDPSPRLHPRKSDQNRLIYQQVSQQYGAAQLREAVG